jgi:hypothetical protein
LEHVVAPSCALNDPALQISHVAFGAPRFFVRNPLRQWQSECRVLPIRDVEFAWHDRHTLLEDAATSDEYVLFPHSVHASGPTVGLYVPWSHARHTAPFAPVYPTLHAQSLASSLPVGAWENDGQLEHVDSTCATVTEYSFASQFVQLPMPGAVLYVPAMHATHATPFAVPEYPALHRQLVSCMLRISENVFAGHSRQSVCAVAAGKVRYLPATQFMHSVSSSDSLYVPGGQASQPIPLGAGVKPGLQLHSDKVLLPVELVLEFAGHAVHAGAPAPAYVFFAHVAQAETLTAASVPEAVPAAQSVQVAVPFVVLYLPGMQAAQTSEGGRRYPVTCTLFMSINVSAPLIM